MKKITFILCLILTSKIYAQNVGDDIVIGKYDRVHSEILNEDRLLLVSLPDGYDKTNIDYPVAYLFYGDRIMQYYAPTISEIDKLSSDGFMPQMIVVGIGNTDRYGNFLPNNRNGVNAGVDDFRKFLKEELFPFVENKFRTKESRIFIAPQASGVFSMNVMFEEQDMFDACFMNNPFRWPYNREYLLNKSLKYFNSNPEAKNYIYASFNLNDELDKIGLEYIRKWEKQIDSLNLKNFHVEVNFQSESNDFVSSLELKDGLKSYFKDYIFPNDVKVESLADIQKFYKDLYSKFGYVPDEPDVIMTLESDKLQQKGEVEKSKEILNYILSKYPESLNALYRLANIYREEGNTEKAIEYYTKCVEINADMAPARRWLETLQKKE